jgi:hypothetical protein
VGAGVEPGPLKEEGTLNMKHLWRSSWARQALLLTALLLVVTTFAAAQGDRGMITGRITDPAGAVIPGVQITATNVATGAKSPVAATDTGDYTIPSLPAGTYTLTAEVKGFRKYEQAGLRVNVAQTIRVDVQLVVGAVTETVEVSAMASLLKTESAEQSTTIQREVINDLPIEWAGRSLIRDPLRVAILTPGTSLGTAWGTDVKFNGLPVTTTAVRMDGMDAGSSLNPQGYFDEQPSVDALEETTVQTSNYAAEYGQVGAALINMTARSGTNQFNGSAYTYTTNEAFNAYNPMPDSHGNRIRPRARQNDFGGNVGGPVWIPKVYDGRNKTFFFFNIEYSHNVIQVAPTLNMPTAAMLAGDFSYYLTGKTAGNDPLGNPMPEGQIYDPFSDFTGSDGRTYRTPVSNNNIASLLTLHKDPVAMKILALLPPASVAGTTNPQSDYSAVQPQTQFLHIPSIKIDHIINSKLRMSGFYTWVHTDRDSGPNGLPYPMTVNRKMHVRTETVRLNFDYTIRPTLFNSLGIGYRRYNYPDRIESAYDYDSAAKLGLAGALAMGFPVMTNVLPASTANGGGGLSTGTNGIYYQDKPTVTEALSWAHGKHMLKFGGEWRSDSYTNRNYVAAMGNYGFDAQQTGLPANNGPIAGGKLIGNNLASFMLGLVNSESIGNVSDPQWKRVSWSMFAQDTFRVSSKLTLDYGLRYDILPGWREYHYRQTEWSPTTPNPSAGNLMGGLVFAGYGTGRCNCKFGSTYPLALAPRLGVAYKFAEKTVLRAGIGVTFNETPPISYMGAGQSIGNGWNTLSYTTSAYGEPYSLLKNGISYNAASLYAQNYNPGLLPLPGQISGPPQVWDKNLGRPARLFNWNISLQREISKDLLVEAAYVGNRGAYWQANGLVNYDVVGPNYYKKFGLDIVNSAADRSLLTSTFASGKPGAAGFSVPYAGFPTSQTLAQALRPYPMYSSANVTFAPIGNNWYDSLQAKVTKRFSKGFTLLAAYTWSKGLANYEGQWNDIYNRKLSKTLVSFDQPQMLAISAMYEVPAFGLTKSNRWMEVAFAKWQIGTVLRYTSGTPIQAPNAQNSMGSLIFQGNIPSTRVAGVPLFLNNPNSADPSSTFVLNPAAWTDPPAGTMGYSAKYYSDYRNRRRPDEQFNIAKTFKLHERASLQVRFELYNAFNRLRLNGPSSGNALQSQSFVNGLANSGFGYVDRTGANTTAFPRTGQIVARITF